MLPNFLPVQSTSSNPFWLQWVCNSPKHSSVSTSERFTASTTTSMSPVNISILMRSGKASLVNLLRLIWLRVTKFRPRKPTTFSLPWISSPPDCWEAASTELVSASGIFRVSRLRQCRRIKWMLMSTIPAEILRCSSWCAIGEIASSNYWLPM